MSSSTDRQANLLVNNEKYDVSNFGMWDNYLKADDLCMTSFDGIYIFGRILNVNLSVAISVNDYRSFHK